MKLIIGLPITEEYNEAKLNSMSDAEKYAYGLGRPDAQSYETTAEFLDALNNFDVDIDDRLWFEIKVEE